MRAGIERILVVAFNQAFGSGITGWQACDVQQAVKQRKIGKQAIGKDPVEVKF